MDQSMSLNELMTKLLDENPAITVLESLKAGLEHRLAQSDPSTKQGRKFTTIVGYIEKACKSAEGI